MSVAKFWQSLPPIAKGVVAIAGTAGIAISGYLIYQGIKKLMARSDSNRAVDAANSELSQTQKTDQPSYPDSTYLSWANQIENLLTGCDANTNDAEVLDIITRLKNDTDWLKLVKAFGTREIKGCAFVANYQADLATVLRNELLDLTQSKILDWFLLSSPGAGKKYIKYRI